MIADLKVYKAQEAAMTTTEARINELNVVVKKLAEYANSSQDHRYYGIQKAISLISERRLLLKRDLRRARLEASK